jgi:hypothetical protein
MSILDKLPKIEDSPFLAPRAPTWLDVCGIVLVVVAFVGFLLMLWFEVVNR